MYEDRKGEKIFFSVALLCFSRRLGKKTTSKHTTHRPHFLVLLLDSEHVELACAVLYKVVTELLMPELETTYFENVGLFHGIPSDVYF